MERHLVEDANRPSRGSKKVAVRTLENEELNLATGDKAPVVTGAEEIKPGDIKRICAIFSAPVPPKKTGAQTAVAPDKTKKKSAQKSAVRPGAKKTRRGAEQPSS